MAASTVLRSKTHLSGPSTVDFAPDSTRPKPSRRWPTNSPVSSTGACGIGSSDFTKGSNTTNNVAANSKPPFSERWMREPRLSKHRNRGPTVRFLELINSREDGNTAASGQGKQGEVLTDVDHYLTQKEPRVASLRSDRHHRNAQIGPPRSSMFRNSAREGQNGAALLGVDRRVAHFVFVRFRRLVC